MDIRAARSNNDYREGLAFWKRGWQVKQTNPSAVRRLCGHHPHSQQDPANLVWRDVGESREDWEKKKLLYHQQSSAPISNAHSRARKPQS